MELRTKRSVIGILGILFLISLIFVQWMEVVRKQEESGRREAPVAVPATSQACVDCHRNAQPGIVAHWEGSTHARKGIGCADCHKAEEGDADGFAHYGAHIATIVTPRDCGKCHQKEAEQFASSHHSKAGNILASLDNFLAETVEGSRVPFDPHGATPGMSVVKVHGMASAESGCQQCHGSKVALLGADGNRIGMDELKPDEHGRPTDLNAVARISRSEDGKPLFHAGTWPNTGIGRINLDGSRGSCSACHSRHDFSPRRARQPENCAKCHLGPDHPQKEIYDESKHGVAYRDLKERMNLDAEAWVLGRDYTAAPTCATCHMSANTRDPVTHDPGERISWTNRPPISVKMDTDAEHRIVTEADPEKRRAQIADTSEQKRTRMKNVCGHCHAPEYVNGFYKQYDALVVLYNEKFARPGQRLMAVLLEQGLRTKTEFDEEVEWTWFYLWHHEGRRARHGASMMAPDYTHWHGMFEVAERFYMELIPQAREIAAHAIAHGREAQGKAVYAAIDEILARPEHKWFKEGAEGQTEAIRKAMQERYGQGSSGGAKEP
ncbi:MAG: multiheme c-type cytochrome [Planctomycetota bacterium]|nr:multiheme c-type cytochrome [Planctomycetota bacterium]